MRMGNGALPKQYLMLGGKPILIHTIEKFLVHERIDVILVLVPADWAAFTEEIIAEHQLTGKEIIVVVGGETRNDTLMKGVEYIEQTYGVGDNDIIVTHEGVRPFVTARIIDENIAGAVEDGAVNTAVSANNTMLISFDGAYISNMPDRNHMFIGQTPQSANLKLLRTCYDSLTDEQIDSLTEMCRIFVYTGAKVRLVMGEYSNIKMTTPEDFELAKAIIGQRQS